MFISPAFAQAVSPNDLPDLLWRAGEIIIVITGLLICIVFIGLALKEANAFTGLKRLGRWLLDGWLLDVMWLKQLGRWLLDVFNQYLDWRRTRLLFYERPNARRAAKGSRMEAAAGGSRIYPTSYHQNVQRKPSPGHDAFSNSTLSKWRSAISLHHKVGLRASGQLEPSLLPFFSYFYLASAS